MVLCGAVVQPSEILREIQTFQTSTCPALVDTDVGYGYIKGVSNPCGPKALICELIAAELGTWFGLEIPPFAIVSSCKIDIPMRNRDGIEIGYIEAPVFFSKAVDGEPRDASDATFLTKLERPPDVAKLVVFDTWIRNLDRHDPRYGEPVENADNLLYARTISGRKYRLIPIDHSLAFYEDDLVLDDDLGALIEDEFVYGCFPEFEGILTSQDVARATGKLADLDRSFVEECVNQIPAQWGLGGASRCRIVEFICERAVFVINTISQKLVADPRFPGI
jgi:HipA-like kinase